MILASTSPYRTQILSDLGFDHQVLASHFEEVFDLTLSPEQNAMMLAEGKAKSVAAKYPNEIVIGCDTVMTDSSGHLLEKPRDREDAKRMWQNRSGKTEVLISGICIISPQGIWKESESAQIEWAEIDEKTLQKILDTNEWEGKCGGIMIEGYSGMFAKKITGNIQNIMGFPVHTFLSMISRLTPEE